MEEANVSKLEKKDSRALESQTKLESEVDLPNTEKKSKRAAQTTTGTKSLDPSRPKYEKPKETSNLKIIIPTVATLFLVISFIVLTVVVFTMPKTDCEIFLDELSSGTNPMSVVLGPIQRSTCLDTVCIFDLSVCSMPCPFGYLSDEATRCVISCECAARGVFEADIQFDERELPKMMKEFGHIVENENDFTLFFGWSGNLWNNIEVDGRMKIPYKLSESLTEYEYKEFENAIRNISKRTCLDYIPRHDEKDYLEIINIGQGCSTHLGRPGGKLIVQLPQGCFFEATVGHELMHSIGFYHEHNREDRDAYVDIFRENIKNGFAHNFDKSKEPAWVNYKSEYELGSGMHYGSYDFSTGGGPTITGKGNKMISVEKKNTFLSLEDYREIGILYECKETGPPKKGEWEEWNSWSECTETCGTGKVARFRYCVHKPTGEKLVSGCEGMPYDSNECNTEECPPLSGKFLEWGEWQECAVTCGKGNKLRVRECSARLQCVGSYFDFQECFIAFCDTGEKVPSETFGTWTEWTDWNKCSSSCGPGSQGRMRKCKYKEEQLAFNFCKKLDTEPGLIEQGQYSKRDCEINPCPGGVSATTTTPSPQITVITPQTTTISSIYTTPPSTTTTRSNFMSVMSTLTTTTTKQPIVAGEWGQWDEWTPCSQTCGSGKKKRYRKCPTDNCEGQQLVESMCKMEDCPTVVKPDEKSGWGEWGDWHPCDKSCGPGMKKRLRECQDSFCPSSHLSWLKCNLRDCPTEGGGVFQARSVSNNKNVCPYGKLLTGNFNIDSHPDLICIYPDGFVRLYYTDSFHSTMGDKVGWEGTTKQCSFSTDEEKADILVMDFDKDGIDDIVCHHQHSKEVYIAINRNGVFNPFVNWKGRRRHCEGVVVVEDMNGDGNADLVCGEEHNSFKYIYISKFKV